MTVTDYHRAALLAGTLEGLLAELRFPLPEYTEREIHQLVCAYAQESKRLGRTPERVIVAVKRMASEAAVFARPGVVELEGRDRLLVDMVRWCIERYYGPPPRGD